MPPASVLRSENMMRGCLLDSSSGSPPEPIDDSRLPHLLLVECPAPTPAGTAPRSASGIPGKEIYRSPAMPDRAAARRHPAVTLRTSGRRADHTGHDHVAKARGATLTSTCGRAQE